MVKFNTMFFVVWGVVALVVFALTSATLGLAFDLSGILTTLMIAGVLVFGANALLGVGSSYVPTSNRMFSGIVAIVLLLLVGFGSVMAVFTGGLGMFSGSIPAATFDTSTTRESTIVSSPSECAAGISDEILGTAATLILNAYDMESNTPYSSAVDVSDYNIYMASSVEDASASNLLTTASDTTAGSVTGVAVGDVITLVSVNSTAGAAPAYEGEPLEGVCITSQRQSITLKAHNMQTEANIQTTVYDDTGSAAEGAGDISIDYKNSQGAGEDLNYYWKIKNNAVDASHWLGAVGFAVGSNISNVRPTGSDASLFTQVATPLHMKDVAIWTNSLGDAQSNSMTRSYTMYKLNSPVRLHEFEFFKFAFVVEADDTNDPVGSENTTDMSFVAGISKDVRSHVGQDGKVYLDFYTHDSAQSDLGLQETEVSPNGKQTGFLMEIE